jgi:hypothetical protein
MSDLKEESLKEQEEEEDQEVIEHKIIMLNLIISISMKLFLTIIGTGLFISSYYNQIIC